MSAPAPQPHRGGLSSLVALLLLELHDGSDRQFAERNVMDTVGMEVDETAIIRGNAPEALTDLLHRAELRKLVPLDVSAVLARMILQKTPGAVECIAQRDINIHVCFVLGAFAAHGDFPAGHGQIDLDVEGRTFVSMRRRRFDDDMTACNTAVKSLQSLDMLAHARLHGW